MRDRLYPVSLFLGTLVLFILTLSPTISLQGDSGELATAVFNLGIPHPPGYPTYILLAKLFTLISPQSNFIFALNLFSAAAGALSVLLLYSILKELTSFKFLSVIMTLFFATSLEFWFHAEIAEVYTLNIFFILLTVFLLLKKSKKFFMLGLILGLGIGVHYFYLVLTPFFLVYQYWNVEKKREFLLLGLGFLLGVSTFLYIPMRAGEFAPLNTLNVNTPHRMAKMVLFPFNGYPKVKKINKSPIVKSTFIKVKRRVVEKIDMLSSYLVQLSKQFYLLSYLAFALFFIFLGLFILKKWRPSKFQVIFGVLFLYTSLGFLYFVGFKKNSSLESEMTPQYITSYLFFTLFIALLLHDLMSHLNKKLKIILILGLSLLLIIQIKNNYLMNNMSENDLADRHAEDLLKAVLPNGILMVSGDNDIHPLLYYQYVLKKRNDVIVINMAATKQEWYYENLRLEYPDFNIPTFDSNFFLGELLNANRISRPIFISNIRNLDELKIKSDETTWKIFANSFYPYKSLYQYYSNVSAYEAILPLLFNYQFETPQYNPSLYLRKREQTVVTNYMIKKFVFGKQLLLNGKKEEALSEFKNAYSYPSLDIELNQTIKKELLKEISL